MKILIVENEHKTALLLKDMIELSPNYTVAAICDSIESAVDYLQQHQQNLNSKDVMAKEKTYQNSFLVRLREKIYPIAVADIAFVYLENEVVYLYNYEGEKFPVLKTLDEIENAIPPQQFYRINRQMIIHRQAIKEIESYHNQRVVVHLNIPIAEKVLVPRLKVSQFFNWIEMGE